MRTLNFSNFVVGKFEILRVAVGDIQSFDIPRDVYERLKKIPQKYYQVPN